MRIVALLPLLVILASCAAPVRHHLVNSTALLGITAPGEPSKAEGWYYVGSDERFDYFKHQDFKIRHYYKTKIGEIDVGRRFPKTSRQSRWTSMPWGGRAPR
ncbi:hypothetical protein DES53_1011057 [Roseimicrobium gellanilyticum]|uniref:Lipoprotein n=1 Tax=Roseimicrobium gellanilyticum TaxID=748857 RepID=A0A366HVG1_9BACT|nr:hypothetical protein DES53_1011057 [Roseimicrobium gellanilyticum]